MHASFGFVDLSPGKLYFHSFLRDYIWFEFRLTIAHLDHMFVLVVKVEADVATITVKKEEDRDAAAVLYYILLP